MESRKGTSYLVVSGTEVCVTGRKVGRVSGTWESGVPETCTTRETDLAGRKGRMGGKS